MRTRRIYDDPPSVRRRNLFNWNSTGQMTLNPLTLFLNGEQGVWYDPSDFSTMFQDSAGTTPVTAVEQPVGKILDKSGRGNHATQATGTKCPLLRQDGNGKYYLYFDGVDDALATSAINFTATDKMTVFVGVRKLTNSSFPVFAEFGSYTGNMGSFTLGGANGGGYVWGSKGTVAANVVVAGFPAPITNVLTGIGSISTDVAVLRANGVQIGALATDQGTGNYGNLALYIGARAGASLFVNGHIYSLIVRGAQSTATQLVSAETYVNSKTGAY